MLSRTVFAELYPVSAAFDEDPPGGHDPVAAWQEFGAT